MSYMIEGLAPEPFETLFHMTDQELAGRHARRAVADGPGYPCRVSLEEAAPGEALVLVNHVSHDAATPFRASHAIYVRERAERARYEGEVPAIFATVPLRRIALLRRVTEVKPSEALYWNNLAAACLTIDRSDEALPAALNRDHGALTHTDPSAPTL